MKQRKTIIVLMTILLAAVVLFGITQETPPKPEKASLAFSVASGSGSETIRCVPMEDGNYMVFLPGYVGLDRVFPILKGEQAAVEGRALEETRSCAGLELHREYPFTYTHHGRTQNSTITFVQSGGVPSMYIDVASGSMTYIHAKKTHKETGVLRLYDADGSQLYSGKLDKIRGRGNSSWDEEKKPYNLTFPQEVDLLGMGAAQKWILLAEAYNSLNIRNKIIYDFAQKVGMPYSPNSAWVDVYLNGEYAGLYLLCEKNEIHPERMDISRKGSFLISMETESRLQAQKIPYVTLGTPQALRIRYASMSDEQLHQIWLRLSRALSAADGVDPTSGKHWQELIDLDSWVKKYLIEEIFANMDGNRLSQFFYMDGGDPSGKIIAGPVWDYDFALGGEAYWMCNFPSYMIMGKTYREDEIILPMFYELNAKPEFQKRLAEIYEETYLPELEKITQTELDAYFAKIERASLANAARWDIPADGVYRDADFIRTFLQRRVGFLSDLWITGTEYHLVCVENTGVYRNGYFMVQDGETLPDLTDYCAADGLGWFDSQTEEPFDITQPIYKDTSIYVKRAEPILTQSILPAGVLIALLLLWMLLDRYHTKKDKGGSHEPAHIA